ncbi:MAG: GAF domain-containing protein [Nitratireductor sp.]|nr:GAF domain-containing protein [Nitratireductor sp.]
MHKAKPDMNSTEIDLSNCDREPIHILGQVQSFGCLLAVSSDWMIVHASVNCAELFGRAAKDLIGGRFVDLFSEESVHHLRTRIQTLAHQDSAVRVFDYELFGDGRRFDVSAHRNDRYLVFEFEIREENPGKRDDSGLVQSLIARVQRHHSVEAVSREAARALQVLCGMDRVMVYRFEEDGSGTVIAEVLKGQGDSYLGLRYPASDIPRQARELYKRSLLRIIADVDSEVFTIIPAVSPEGHPLDLSLAVTRAVSPIHIEYLRNMGVKASLSVSILRKGELWGLFACHHNSPLTLDYERRSAVELFVQLFNYELAQLETTGELEDVDRARSLHDRLMSQVSGGETLVDVFESLSDQIAEVIPFDGIVVYSNGVFRAQGAAPTEEEFLGLARFLNTAQTSEVFATDCIASRFEKADSFADRAAGLLALPISRSPRDYLVLFRREIAQSVNWAGNPEKPVTVGPNGSRLTPRKSFEAWQEVVRGKSGPWKISERRAADELRVTLLEVVLKLADEASANRKRAQEQQELLIAELNHRVRNILNLIRGLVSQGRGNSVTIEEYSAVLDSRIHSLARAHDQLTEKGWGWVSLLSLIRTEIGAFLSEKSERVVIEGVDVTLSPTAFTTLALVIHELVTNSAKYGSLNDSSGIVHFGVTLNADGSCAVSWRESGGPPVQAPKRRGFGTTIIERSIPFELKGKADVAYKVSGLEADFLLPAPHVAAATGGQELEAGSTGEKEIEEVQLRGSALVLEDNMIIAMDAADMLRDLGAETVHLASSVVDALRIMDAHTIEFALLDVNLGDENSLRVAERCARSNIACVLATGYGKSGDAVKSFPQEVVVRKPYTIEDVKRAVADELR